MGIFNSKNYESNEKIKTNEIQFCEKQSNIKVSLSEFENKIMVKLSETNPTTTLTNMIPEKILCNNDYLNNLEQMLNEIRNINPNELIGGHIYEKTHEKTLETTKELITIIHKKNPKFQPSINASIHKEIEFNYNNKITGDILYDVIYIYDENSNIREFNSIEKSTEHVLFLLDEKKMI